MISEPPPPVPWLVENLVVKGTLTLLSGLAGQGKSLLTQAIATAAVGPTGGDVAGLVVEPCRVLVVDSENGPQEIHRRVHTLGLARENTERLSLYVAEGFHLGRDLNQLDALVRGVKPDLLILDSFRSLWAIGDENKSEDVASVLEPVRNFVRHHQAGTILVHHSPKNGQTHRGSSAIAASVELAFVLERAERDDDRQRRRLRAEKSRPAPEPPDRWLRLATEQQLASGVPPIQAADPFIEPHRERAPTRLALVKRIVAEVSANGPMTRAEIARQAGRDPSDGTLRRAVAHAVEQGSLVARDDDRFEPASQHGDAD